MAEQIDTLVIGGGQAGLSVSCLLKAVNHEHLVLDRGEVGDTWRNRWDSFCLVTPNHYCRLPGFPYPGSDPGGFMLRDEIVDYVEAFADSFNPPIRNGIDVLRISQSASGDQFEVETSAGDFEASNVIVATGTHQHPRFPSWCNQLDRNILQLHSSEYFKPNQLPDGSVLVVGSGQSGCQIVEDLHFADRDVYLSVGKAGRIPRRYRDRDIIDWLFDAGFMNTPVNDHPLGTAVRFMAHEHLSGRDGGRTIDLRRMAQGGVNLLGRLTVVDGCMAYFQNDLTESLDAIDEECQETLSHVDNYIAENHIEAPSDDLQTVDWQPGPEPETLDLEKAGISSVIYATGFTYDFSWIDLPIFDDRGYPRYERGVTELPGLYFVGLHWMHTAGSGLFSQVGRDAEYVVEKVRQNHGQN